MPLKLSSVYRSEQNIGDKKEVNRSYDHRIYNKNVESKMTFIRDWKKNAILIFLQEKKFRLQLALHMFSTDNLKE